MLVVVPAITGEQNVVYEELLKPELKRNQSVAGVASRLIPSAALQSTVIVDAAIFALAAVLLARKRSGRLPSGEAAEIGIVSRAMLCLSPVAWAHHFVVLLLPT